MWALGIGLRSSDLTAGLDLLSHLASPVSQEVKASRRVAAAQGPTLKPHILLVADSLCSCQLYPLTLVVRHPIIQYYGQLIALGQCQGAGHGLGTQLALTGCSVPTMVMT